MIAYFKNKYKIGNEVSYEINDIVVVLKKYEHGDKTLYTILFDNGVVAYNIEQERLEFIEE